MTLSDSMAFFRRLRVTSDSANLVPGSHRIMAVQISCNGGVADVEFCFAATDTSSDELTFHLLDGTSLFYDYTNLGGIAASALTVDISGNVSSCNIWVDG